MVAIEAPPIANPVARYFACKAACSAVLHKCTNVATRIFPRETRGAGGPARPCGGAERSRTLGGGVDRQSPGGLDCTEAEVLACGMVCSPLSASTSDRRCLPSHERRNRRAENLVAPGSVPGSEATAASLAKIRRGREWAAVGAYRVGGVQRNTRPPSQWELADMAGRGRKLCTIRPGPAPMAQRSRRRHSSIAQSPRRDGVRTLPEATHLLAPPSPAAHTHGETPTSAWGRTRAYWRVGMAPSCGPPPTPPEL